MKKIIFTLALFMFAGNISYAALPPLYQGIREIKAIIEHQEFSENLGSHEVVMDIVRIEQGYLIITNYSHMIVEVVYLPQEMSGPGQFELIFNNPVSIK